MKRDIKSMIRVKNLMSQDSNTIINNKTLMKVKETENQLQRRKIIKINKRKDQNKKKRKNLTRNYLLMK